MNQVQNLNVRRSQLIVDTLAKKYKAIFNKDYIPVGNRKSATSQDDVNKAEKAMVVDQLKKLVG